MKVLVTGGCGYIGSHTVLVLLNYGYDVVVADNLVNSSLESLNRVQRLAGKTVSFFEGDIRNLAFLESVFNQSNFDGVIHFAGLKAVGESSSQPLSYYDCNVSGSITLFSVMRKYDVKNLIFSSSATVYGSEAPIPYLEKYSRGLTSSPYGASKAMIERILEDLVVSDASWSASLLRYFNPIGAHESGMIGEDPKGIPNNLMPFITQVGVGKREKLSVFGGDYDTPDGTCRRDYLHVMDLAEGHVKALQYTKQHTGCEIFNLGSGSPVSVLQMISAFENVSNISLPYEIVGRRDGDLPEFWADSSKANSLLNWHCNRSLTTMVEDAWRWQIANPNGYS